MLSAYIYMYMELHSAYAPVYDYTSNIALWCWFHMPI